MKYIYATLLLVASIILSACGGGGSGSGGSVSPNNTASEKTSDAISENIDGELEVTSATEADNIIVFSTSNDSSNTNSNSTEKTAAYSALETNSDSTALNNISQNTAQNTAENSNTEETVKKEYPQYEKTSDILVPDNFTLSQNTLIDLYINAPNQGYLSVCQNYAEKPDGSYSIDTKTCIISRRVEGEFAKKITVGPDVTKLIAAIHYFNGSPTSYGFWFSNKNTEFVLN